MRYNKFKATQLFTGYKMFGADKVLITNEGGKIKDLVDVNDAGEDVITFDGILCPGLINCHCHLELSHMKGLIPEHTGLINFVFNVVTQRHFEEEEILAAIDGAEQEMLRNGIVAVGDICNNVLTAAQKKKGLMSYYNFVETSGWLPGVANERFAKSKTAYNLFQTITNSTSIVPHAPYSVSPELWKNIAPFFAHKVTSIHNQETAFEDEFFKQGTGDFIRMYELMKIDNSHFTASGKTSVRSFYHNLRDAATVILVHNTYTSKEDINFTNQQAEAYNQKLYWCLCPGANKYIENKLPDVMSLIEEGSQVVLGTDSLASNHSLNIVSEIKLLKENYPLLNNDLLLSWATINGAKALQMQEQFGSFETNKTPGVVLIKDDFSSVSQIL